MLKKLSAVLLSLMMISTVVPFGILAVQKSNNLKTYSDFQTNNEGKVYADYCDEHNDYKIIANSLTFDAEKIKHTGELVNNSVLCNGKNSMISFDCEFKESSLAEILINYTTLENSKDNIELEILIDGKSPFAGAERIVLPKYFENDGKARIDSLKNEFAPKQREVYADYSFLARDSLGVVSEPYLFAFSAGKHIVSIKNVCDDSVLIKSVSLNSPENIPEYKDYSANFSNEKLCKTLCIEGENAVLKSDKSLTPKADRSSCEVNPNSYNTDVLNYIGSNNWSKPGQKIVWKVSAETSGIYKVAFKYKQGYVLNGNSYRKLYIDDKIPFKEAQNIAFPYTSKWVFIDWQNKSGKPYYIYLEKGEHTLSLEVTMGPMAQVYTSLKNEVETLGNIYRKMIMIMGTDPDANRDYDLFTQINGLEATLKNTRKNLSEIIKKINGLTGKKSDSNTVVISEMNDTVGKLLDNPYKTQRFVDDYYNNYCSIGAVLSELKNMPLDLDRIYLYNSNQEVTSNENFWKHFSFSIKRYFSTFVDDYNSMQSENSGKKISVWLYWGKDQVQVLKNLITESFTPETGIGVDIKITSASLIQALLSDNTPDLYLRMTPSEVMNLSMRGAICNLKQFDDYDEVCKRFSPNSVKPYLYQNGSYALPDTQTFNMLFCRTDIFQEYGLKVPETWEDFLNLSTFFFHNNLQVGMPNTFNAFATFLYQIGGTVYNSDCSRVRFSSDEFVSAFSTYTDFFTEYGFELTYDFYNRFRTGEMPMAIADYIQYNTLKVSAPEIDGKWVMMLIPGTYNEKGQLIRTNVADGTGSCIIKKSKNKDSAWKFLKWWMSESSQIKYNNECESVLGSAARQNSANIEAVKGISWDKADLDSLTKQWENLETVEETPGSYYTQRMYFQAFWDVVNNDTNKRNTIIKWGNLVNQEISRKRKEYNLE